MKVAYAGYDILINCLEMLWSQGNEVIKIFTIPSGDSYDRNEKTLAFAYKNHIDIQTTGITQEDLQNLEQTGCQLLIAAGYTCKIPVISSMMEVNVHPSLLPVGRGPWPMPVMILRRMQQGGVTLHKLTDTYDAGDIILQETFPLDEKENLLGLTRKIQEAAEVLLTQFLADAPRLYDNALKQDTAKAEYWMDPSDTERRLLPDMPLSQVDKRLRAFAGYGCIYDSGKEITPVDFVDFREISLADRETVNRIRQDNQNTLSAYSFPCIYCWRELQKLQIYYEEDWFVVKVGEHDYYYPCGNPVKTELFLRMLVWNHQYFRLGYIPAEYAEFLKQEHAEIHLLPDRNNFDYLVPVSQIAHLTGKHYQTIRKEIHQFERSGLIESEVITKENVHIVKQLALQWSRMTLGEEEAADTLAEESAVDYFEELQMQGILARKNGAYFGFVMGSAINDQVIDAHFAKCVDKSTGADYYCKQQFCQYLEQQYQYMNMEEDMGIEGIRTRKLLLHPSSLTPVFLATYDNRMEHL